MGSTRDMRSTAAGQRVGAPSPTELDRWLRVIGSLLAWAGVAAAIAGAFRRAPAPSSGIVALAITLCACAVLAAWALAPASPPRARHVSPLHRVETEPRTTVEPGSVSAPPTTAITRPTGNRFPLVAPPRPLYALDELAGAGVTEAAHSPYLDDPLFRLEDPRPGAWLVRVGKDPTQLCQDSFACDPARRVYAVTDGVSRSFMPAAWARIVAQAAVARPGPFGSEAEFAAWLEAAADRWRAWMREVWLPQAAPRDWSNEIDGQGAQTTLVCCSIGDGSTRARAQTVRVDVTAIGDAEWLLFRPDAGHWELVAAFPLEHPSDFGAIPATLSTRHDPARTAATYRSLRRATFEARPGDRLALATDAIACWLLAQAQGCALEKSVASPSASPSPRRERGSGGEDSYAHVLDDRDAFERLAQVEIDAGRLEDDDLTLLVIAIA